MALAIAIGLSQRLPFVVKQRQLNCRLGRAVLKTLSEDIQLVMVAMQRYANIA